MKYVLMFYKFRFRKRGGRGDTIISRCRDRDRARRAAQSSQATKNCRGSETADRDRRKKRLGSESAEENET